MRPVIVEVPYLNSRAGTPSCCRYDFLAATAIVAAIGLAFAVRNRSAATGPKSSSPCCEQYNPRRLYRAAKTDQRVIETCSTIERLNLAEQVVQFPACPVQAILSVRQPDVVPHDIGNWHHVVFDERWGRFGSTGVYPTGDCIKTDGLGRVIENPATYSIPPDHP